MQELRANTEVKVRIGPFPDVGDGFTPQIDITLGGDEAELLKHNGVATVDISGNTWAAIAGCRGWYDLTLTTDDTNTEGMLTAVVQDDSDCLPVFAHFMVLSEAAWDSKYVAKDDGYINVNVASEDNIDFGATKKASITAAVPAVSAIADAVWTEDLTDHDTEPYSGAENLKEILADTNELQTDDIPTSLADLNTLLTFVKNVTEGDVSIDKSGTPYQLVVKIKGTDTELVRKDIADVDGNDLASTATVIGRITEPA